MLENVEEAVAANDYEGALALALDVWRENRYAILADLIDAIEAHLPLSKPFPHNQKEFQAEWLRRASDQSRPLDSLLLASLARSVPMPQRQYWAHGANGERYSAWRARVERILARPHDPRAARAALDVLDKSTFTIGWEVDAASVYGPLLTILEHADDERLIPRIERLAHLPTATRQTVRRYYKTSLPLLKEKLQRSQSVRRPIDPTVQERAAALIQQLGGIIASPAEGAPRKTDAEEEASLLEMVIENPDDDAARAVLADFWLERNDPRGELINLQLKEARGEATAADQKSIRALLRAHEKTWLGELALVTKRRVFRRGFLDEVELQQNSAADPGVWEATTTSALLATVRLLRKGKANDRHYRDFVLSPALRSLRSLTLQRKTMLGDALLRTTPWPIHELVLTFTPERAVVETLTRVRATTFSHLRKVTFGVKPGHVKKAIALAKTLDSSLSCVAVTPVSWYNEDTSELADWLRAARGTLSHVPSVEIVFFVGLREDRLVATRSNKSRLVLDFAGESLYFIDPMLRALDLTDVDHLRLRAPAVRRDRAAEEDEQPATPIGDVRLRGLVERFGRKVALDEAWSRAYEAS